MNIVVILAGGKSERMDGVDKVQTELLGKPVWKHSFDIFKKSKKTKKVFLVINKKFKTAEKINCISGGKSRYDSAKIAFEKILRSEKLKDSDVVIFHNAANPLVTSRELENCIDKAKKYGACIVGTPAVDTIKVTEDGKIIGTLPRENVILAQTPQAFQVGILKKAYRQKKKTTDESMLVENEIDVRWIPASPYNRKITTSQDLEYIRSVYGEVATGIGTDSHRFDNKGKLKIAGITIKSYPKLKANSDGDIALHALATAFSQALGQGSLGTFADAMNKQGIKNSGQFFKPLLRELKKKNFHVGHVGLHFECQNPQIDPLVPSMKKSISKLLKTKSENIGITATTGEGYVNGIHCIAVINLWKK